VGNDFLLPSITPLAGVLELGPRVFFGGSAGTKVQDNPGSGLFLKVAHYRQSSNN
jgi:hypothetical protein